MKNKYKKGKMVWYDYEIWTIIDVFKEENEIKYNLLYTDSRHGEIKLGILEEELELSSTKLNMKDVETMMEYIYKETEEEKEYNELKSELECYIQNSIGKFEDTLRNMIKKYDVKKIYDLKFKIQLIPLIEMESEKEGNNGKQI